MPRLTENNPSDRLQRLLAEYDKWIRAHELLVTSLGYHDNEVVRQLHYQSLPMPPKLEHMRESVFQHHTRKHTLYNRKHSIARRREIKERTYTDGVLDDPLNPRVRLNLYENSRENAEQIADNIHNPGLDHEQLVNLILQVDINEFIANHQIPVKELQLKRKPLNLGKREGQTDGVNEDALQSTREPDNPDPP
jgi:hypothetical protein